MLPELLSAFFLLALCVVVHALGLAVLLRLQPRLSHAVASGGLRISWLLVKIACGLLVLHLVEIAIWALFFRWQGCLNDLETAFYFSVTYSTVGYGDVVLPPDWRLLGPMEGLSGILMCGLSTGFFFVVLSRIHQVMTQESPVVVKDGNS
jgi:hypothetical protein